MSIATRFLAIVISILILIGFALAVLISIFSFILLNKGIYEWYLDAIFIPTDNWVDDKLIKK